MAPACSSLSKDPIFFAHGRGFLEVSGAAGLFAPKGSRLRCTGSAGRKNSIKLMASNEFPDLNDNKANSSRLKAIEKSDVALDPFATLKSRFLTFKRQHFLKNAPHFENLAEAQTPKFLVIACADSRVCPSLILGFQAGEAFIVRNVANFVPPFESGPSGTKAALEFGVNTLEVSNILIIGHSRCGGIRALMSMQDEDSSNYGFIGEYVAIGRPAKIRTKAAVPDHSFEHQCRHCEKESISNSISNLISYPWIEKKVSDGNLSIHGGYYDFIDCTFEKWTLDHQGTRNGGVSFKDNVFWC